MAIYWKEIVNFASCEHFCLISVAGGKGELLVELATGVESAKVRLFLEEGVVLFDVQKGKNLLEFETSGRGYFVEILAGEKIVCEGGNRRDFQEEYKKEQKRKRKKEKEEKREAKEKEEKKEKHALLERGLGVEKPRQEIKKDKQGKEEEKEEARQEKPEATKDVEESVEKGGADAGVCEISDGFCERVATENYFEKESVFPSNTAEDVLENQHVLPPAKIEDVERILKKFPRDEFLESATPKSRWARVPYSRDISYGVGKLEENGESFVGYAIRGKLASPPKVKNPQFLPVSGEGEEKEGYFLIFQPIKAKK